MKTKNKIILSLVGLIASLLMIVAGMTYAWFILVVDTPDEDTNSIIVKSADLGKTIFYNGDTISINGAYPGWCETKKVSVVSENSTVLKKYYIYLNVVTNELEKLGSTYGYVTMKSTVVTDETTAAGGSTGKADLQNITYTSGKLLILAGEIAASDKHTYNIEFCFPELSANQNSQQGKVFNAYLSVDTNIIHDADEQCEPAVAFSSDSWKTIACNVKNGNTSAYNVGDTREITLDGYGTHEVRVSNTSIPDECKTDGFSQTACGFVLEFTDILTTYKMNSSNTNVGGWPVTLMRTFVNNNIYNALPEDLRNVIIDTTVVSGHGNGDKANFTTVDKLYLLSTAEIWAQGSSNTITIDSARNVTRQLDYYLEKGVKTDVCTAAIKEYNSANTIWYLRSPGSSNNTLFFDVNTNGCWTGSVASSNAAGVSPAFRIG